MLATANAQQKASMAPFLKWAGGKRWLCSLYPQIFPSQYSRYIEPFLGGGATFFALAPRYAILSDLNHDLILTYNAIRDNWHGVQTALDRHQRNHSRAYYYKERARIHRTQTEQAAQFLYLNRTCWNGLYRVNLRGQFNVPKGTKTRVVLPSDNFELVAHLLREVKIYSQDFEATLAEARKNDFVFVDPPYTAMHNANGFVKYNEKIFTWDDQIRLMEAIKAAAKTGAKILITNADHISIRKLYAKIGSIHRLERRSIIAGATSARGQTTELAITINYAQGGFQS